MHPFFQRIQAPSVRGAYALYHLCVLLWGFTVILGALIQLSGLILVWWRLSFTLFTLLLLPGIRKGIHHIPTRQRWQIAGIGCLAALHWVTFYGAIKLGNASVAVSCLSTMSFIAALIEPPLLQRPFRWHELWIGLAVVPAMALIFWYTGSQYGPAIGVGILSALLSATFGTLNKRLVGQQVAPQALIALEMGSGFLLLTLLSGIYLATVPRAIWKPTGNDWLWLLLLSGGCTTVPFLLSLYAMKRISAFTAMLILNLEPLYGIVLAWWILRENHQLHSGFYLGVAIILSSVFIHPILLRRHRRTQ